MSTSLSDTEPPAKRLKFTEVKLQPLKMKTRQVNLLPVEDLLKRLLLDCRDNLPPNETASKLELRFTGGWVRDKLLGIQSHDIDVGLSSMTGMQFGKALQSFVRQAGSKYENEAQKLGVAGGLKGLHQIAANPERSKHLETVTTKLFGLDIDLVNLRKETYSEDSRNPQMEFGNPEEDALRRDATVNALFYNLDTEQVEDFTRRGLDDLAAGIIRTPLEPYQTFMDDPLRVLRLFRFASRLGYTIDDTVKLSMADEHIHAALNAKISRERVGVEVLKMINGENPLMAFQLIHTSNLYSTVFLDPCGRSHGDLQNLLPNTVPEAPWPPTWPHAYEVLASLLDSDTEFSRTLTKTEADAESVWLAAAYAPLLALGAEQIVANARGAVKATNKISKLLEKAAINQVEIVSLVNLTADPTTNPRRSTVGMAIKSWGATWRTQVLYSLLAQVVLRSTTDDFFEADLKRYKNFVETIGHLKLQDAAFMKPLLRGDEVQKLFNVKKSGPWMKDALDSVTKWQFDHEGDDKEAAKQWLLGQREALGIP